MTSHFKETKPEVAHFPWYLGLVLGVVHGQRPHFLVHGCRIVKYHGTSEPCRASLSAESLRKRTFVRAEILSELATRSATAFALLAANDLGEFENAGVPEMDIDMTPGTESPVDWG